MKNILCFFILFVLLSCGNQSSESYAPQMKDSSGFIDEVEMESEEDFDPQPEPPAPPQNEAPRQKKIIKDGQMNLVVDNLKKAKAFVDSTLKKYDAYYENEAYESSNYRSSYNLKIRIPTDSFEKFVKMASEDAGKVTFKNINTRDVTEEFYDVKTRLENNESYLIQYRNLLKRANSIKDVLEVQEKIRRLEEEMDSKKGRLKYISDKVKYSTLNLNLIESHEYQAGNEKSFFEKIGSALKDGVDIFSGFILVVLRLWPFVILISILIYFFRKWRKKRVS